MPKRNLDKINLGSFEMVTGDMVVSDPCYDLGTWCMGVLNNVLLGQWQAFMLMSDEKEWGMRVAELHARAKIAFPPTSTLDKDPKGWKAANFEVGVDSGQAGMFDKSHFKDNSLATKENTTYKERFYTTGPGEKVDRTKFTEYDSQLDDGWYGICCAQTLGTQHGGVIPFGVVSSSGYGDGGYGCRYLERKGKIVAVKIRFI